MAWEKGQSGNPKGRPKSARQKLSEGFLRDVQEKWKECGSDVLDRVIAEQPAKFLECITRILPKQIEAEITDNRKAEDMTDDELASVIAEAAKRGRSGERAAEEADSAVKLH